MPETGIRNKPHQELLSFEEVTAIVKIMARLGIEKVRLTGGEPLVRKGLIKLVSILNNIEGIKDISITTNGVLLEEYAFKLKTAGLKRINISLNSLKQTRYNFITRRGNLADVLAGIRGVLKAGFSLLKINVLLLDDISVEEIGDFLRFTLENPICVRFLEFMPVNSFYKQKKFIYASAVMDIAERFYIVEEAAIPGDGPARTYRFKNALGSFGIINPMSNKFCAACNRLRLTSDGFLKPCLHSELKINLREPLRQGRTQEELTALIKQAIFMKPKEHFLDKAGAGNPEDFSMCQVGG